MSQIMFFLTNLRSTADRDSYEQWVREVDQQAAESLPGVQSYRVVRLEGPVLDGIAAPDYDYIEIFEVDDLDAYRNALPSVPESVFAAFRSYIGPHDVVAGTVVR